MSRVLKTIAEVEALETDDDESEIFEAVILDDNHDAWQWDNGRSGWIIVGSAKALTSAQLHARSTLTLIHPIDNQVGVSASEYERLLAALDYAVAATRGAERAGFILLRDKFQQAITNSRNE
ncbi:MAG TPA: hypothetical protein VLS51_11040 [Propionibacteriaceae bacterium]|nr:hypothetical protein [Propionibacteriaceae bacterium]